MECDSICERIVPPAFPTEFIYCNIEVTDHLYQSFYSAKIVFLSPLELIRVVYFVVGERCVTVLHRPFPFVYFRKFPTLNLLNHTLSPTSLHRFVSFMFHNALDFHLIIKVSYWKCEYVILSSTIPLNRFYL